MTDNDINKRLCELLGLPFDDNTGSLARSAVKFLTKRSQCEEKYQRKGHNGMVGGENEIFDQA